MTTNKKYVLIDKEKLKTDPMNSISLFGNMTALFKSVKINIDSWDKRFKKVKPIKRAITYSEFTNLLGEKKQYNDKNYLIKRCEVLTSKRKKL